MTTKIDVKIGEDIKPPITQNQNDINYENLKLEQKIQYLHSLILEMELKRRKQHNSTNNLLIWILVSMLIYIVPDIIIKIIKILILANVLQ